MTMHERRGGQILACLSSGRTLHVSDLCPSAAVGGLDTPSRNRLFSEVTEGAGELIGVRYDPSTSAAI
jgi:hypothetical protein